MIKPWKMFKNFFLKKVINSKLKDMPSSERERVSDIVLNNPDLFQKIGEETKRLMKEEGLDQMTATMRASVKFKKELSDLRGKY